MGDPLGSEGGVVGGVETGGVESPLFPSSGSLGTTEGVSVARVLTRVVRSEIC